MEAYPAPGGGVGLEGHELFKANANLWFYE